MALLRVVLDHRVVHEQDASDADVMTASRGLVDGILATAPHGCQIEAITPADAAESVPGVSAVRRLRVPRAPLALAWRHGVVAGVGGGMIHSPTLMAPLVRHDRANDHDQTVVTMWDLRAWDAPETLAKGEASWQRAMLQRAVKHADAVVVPVHALAERLAEIAPLGDRVRVIAGAPPTGFSVTSDAADRRSAADMPERYAVIVGRPADAALRDALAAAAASDLDVVVLGVPLGAEGTLDDAEWKDAADAAGMSSRLHLRGALDADDRAAVLAGAAAIISTDATPAWPWRLVEALAIGVPVIAIDTPVHRDVLADGATLVDGASLGDALAEAVGTGEKRMRVLAADRGRAFSWISSGEQVWALHAEL